MRERPILFSGPMVSALLAGRKTQTRRLVKLDQPNCWEPAAQDAGDLALWHFRQKSSPPTILKVRCRYGSSGDRLYCKETWGYKSFEDAQNRRVTYRADTAGERQEHTLRWRPSIHMPRWASRLKLEVVSVRVERVQSISEADAIAEGIRFFGTAYIAGVCVRQFGIDDGWVAQTAAGAYSVLWNRINGAGSWAANPWVFVVEFRRVTP